MADIGNQSRVVHGGAGAMQRISEGKSFLGIAAETEKEITAELAESGLASMVERDAIRLQTAADLYYGAVLKAAADGDIALMDRYVARFGWIAGVTIRAWETVNRLQSKKAGGNVIDLLGGGKHD